MPWLYDPRSKRYRNTDTGRFMGQKQVFGLVNQTIDAGSEDVAGLARLAGSSQMSPGDFNQVMRDKIKYSYIRQYALGRGGLAQMTQEDWGSIGGMLADQYRYLDPFTDQLGNLTEGQIAARAAMYIRSSREAYERGKVRAYGMSTDDLPVYPGQGSTQCLTNCRCNWKIDEVREGGALIGFDAYWELGATDQHCSDCLSYAGEYNPYSVRL